MSRRTDRADEGLLQDNYAALNADFYEGKPWLYFDRRLMHVARLAADPEGYHDALDEAVRIGPMEVAQVARALSEDEPSGLDDQSFVAAEAQVLLHHTAETLLRLLHAHAPDTSRGFPACPWLTMSRLTSPRQFKGWARRRILDSSPDERRGLVEDVFAGVLASETEADAVTRHIRLCARHFLDADSYNAAKHGFALQGSHSRLNVEVENVVAFETEGLTIDWLAARGQEPRWVRTTRWFSVGTTLALAFFATRLIRGLWESARHRYLDEPISPELRVPDPSDLFGAFNVPDAVLAEREEPLWYEGVERTMTVRKTVRRPGI